MSSLVGAVSDPWLAALAWTLASTAFAGATRLLRLHRRSWIERPALLAVGFAQDLAVGLLLGSVQAFLGTAAAMFAVFVTSLVVWMDHVLQMRVQIRFQPRALSSPSDLADVWSSVRALCLGALVEGAIGILLACLLILALAADCPTHPSAGVTFVMLAIAIAGLQHAGPRDAGAEHVFALLHRASPRLHWFASPLPVGPALPHLQEEDPAPSPTHPLWRPAGTFPGEPVVDFRRRDKPHVLLILMESFAAQHAGARWGATPSLDAWSRRGLSCSQAYGNGVRTVLGITSSLFGIPPRISIQPLDTSPNSPRLVGLPEILSEHGWHTAFWHAGSVEFHGQGTFLRRHGVLETVGSEILETLHPDGPRFGSWGLHDEVLFRYARNRLREVTGPTFSLMLTLSHHNPWTPPPAWSRVRFPGAEGCLGEFLTTLSYSDAQLGAFLEGLESDGLLEDSVVVITGDHGALTGDGMTFDSLYHLKDHGMRVPLVFLAPGRLEPGVCDEPASQIDILPTLLDLLGIDAWHHSVGRSLLRRGHGPVPLSNPFCGGWLGLREGPWKVVLRPDSTHPHLYDVLEDPTESRDLSGTRPDVATSLQARCVRLHRTMEELYARDGFAPRAAPPFHPGARTPGMAS